MANIGSQEIGVSGKVKIGSSDKWRIKKKKVNRKIQYLINMRMGNQKI